MTTPAHSASASKHLHRGPLKVDWSARSEAVKAKWPTLTAADFSLAEGTYEELFARIAKRTGEDPADVEAAFATIPEPVIDWDVLEDSLRTKWPTLMESDLVKLKTGSRHDLMTRIRNRTSEEPKVILDVVDASVAEAAKPVR